MLPVLLPALHRAYFNRLYSFDGTGGRRHRPLAYDQELPPGLGFPAGALEQGDRVPAIRRPTKGFLATRR